MIRKTTLIMLMSLLVIPRISYPDSKGDTKMEKPVFEQELLAFTVKDIDGKDVNLLDFKGKVVMVVNVASKCGFTPQYEGLEKLYKQYKDKGLVILGFPANNFLSQEPGSDSQIKTFCTTTYGVSFPMFAKVSVAGKDIHPFFQELTSADPRFKGKVTWNFNKFLIGRDGKLAARFDSKVKPESKEMTEILERLLATK